MYFNSFPWSGAYMYTILTWNSTKYSHTCSSSSPPASSSDSVSTLPRPSPKFLISVLVSPAVSQVLIDLLIHYIMSIKDKLIFNTLWYSVFNLSLIYFAYDQSSPWLNLRFSPKTLYNLSCRYFALSPIKWVRWDDNYEDLRNSCHLILRFSYTVENQL